MLDSVRCGRPTDETIRILESRVIKMSTADMLVHLQQCGHTPLCLFPIRKACDEFESAMITSLPSEIQTLSCTDEVDETASKSNWTKRAEEQLEKLNNNCNRTAGLEAKLLLE